MLSRTGRRIFSSCCITQPAIYEVAISFNDKSISKQYYNWLSNHHVKEVLDFPGFVSAELLILYGGGNSIEADSSQEGIVVRYTLESLNVFDDYNKSDLARRLRKDAIEQFGDKFTAQRRVLLTGDVIFK